MPGGFRPPPTRDEMGRGDDRRCGGEGADRRFGGGEELSPLVASPLGPPVREPNLLERVHHCDFIYTSMSLGEIIAKQVL